MASPLTPRLVRCVCSAKEVFASDSSFCSLRYVGSTTCQEIWLLTSNIFNKLFRIEIMLYLQKKLCLPGIQREVFLEFLCLISSVCVDLFICER